MGDSILGPDAAQATRRGKLSLSDFYAYMPMHNYIFAPARELWPSSSVNARVPLLFAADGTPILPSTWLDANAPVEQMSWCPGHPMIIKDRLVGDGGWIERPGCDVFNLYRPPIIVAGDVAKANRWIEHAHKVFGDDARHIIMWLAHRVQKPHEKINHALVLGGAQGIGKDTLLEPIKVAVGPWNFIDISPQQLMGRFNGFSKSVILRVSEARDLGDVDRFALYDHLKVFAAAPPDVLRVDEKHIREYAIFNVCGVIITTNHKSDGIFLPADDRRHFVAWSSLTKDDFTQDYWDEIWRWLADGGNGDVATYLRSVDLSGFNPKAPPPKTQVFWDIVDANRTPEDAEIADALDLIGNPPAVALDQIVAHATADLALWLRDRKNARRIPHRLESCGYTPVRNDGAKDGLWKLRGRRQAIYARADLSLRDRLSAAYELAGAR